MVFVRKMDTGAVEYRVFNGTWFWVSSLQGVIEHCNHDGAGSKGRCPLDFIADLDLFFWEDT